MKISRLFEIVYLLLDKKTITAKQLAERFEVSTRTIYRDIDVLSSCGIPIYTNKGKNGGISLIEGFKMDKVVLTEAERDDVLYALQGLNAVSSGEANSALEKLSAFFGSSKADWIDIDFSYWNNDHNFKDKFEKIKSCILNSITISIEYSNINGQTTRREIHPVKLVFKATSWYVSAFCTQKNDFRTFKLSRISDIIITQNKFTPYSSVPKIKKSSVTPLHKEKLVLCVDQKYAFRLMDDFPSECIAKNGNGDYIVTTDKYNEDWIISYILAFGSGAKCLEPLSIRQEIIKILGDTAKNYL
jgi:predicted DNA-binding transcriptional regulator YafY